MKAHRKNVLLKLGVLSVFVLPFSWYLGYLWGDAKYNLFLIQKYGVEQKMWWYFHDTAHYLVLTVLGLLLWTGSNLDWLRHSGKVLFWYSLFRLLLYWMMYFKPWLEWTSVAIIIYLMFYYVDRKYNIYSATIITLQVGWDKLRSVLRF